ncbi:MAG: PEGA domain-containing protein [Defluviitaleaceae bacterium]|nr:PEGA domain-containing protein [Defluviitaleaceae bacterium]
MDDGSTLDKNNLYNSQRIPKLLEKDGVIYVPSGEAPVPEVGALSENSDRPGLQRRSRETPKRKMKPQKSQLALFYILTLTIGVIISVAVFGIVLNYFTNSDLQTAQPPQPPLLADAGAASGISIAEKIEVSGVISDINLADQRMRVMDAETGETITLNVAQNTTFLNRNRVEVSFASFSIGNIVDIRYDAATSTAENVQISPSGWEHRMISSVHINTDRRSIGIGTSNYSYDDSTIVIYRNYRFDIERIAPIDIVTVSGFRSRALFVEVNRSHGTVRFLNTDEVRGGTVEINTSMFRQLADSEEMLLLEGAHRIVVRGDNIEPMVREIVLANNETIEIDLAQAQYRTGLLTVNINIDDYTLEIDGVEHSSDEPIVLALDEEHSVSVTSEGYIPFLQIVRLTEPALTLDIELTELVQMGMLVINTTPPGATVLVNNSVVGTSPVSELLPFGFHNISIRHEGYDTWSMQFDLNQPRQEYQVVLTPNTTFPTASPPPQAIPFPTHPPGTPGAPGAGLPTPMPFQSPNATPPPAPIPFPTTPPPPAFPTPAPTAEPYDAPNPASEPSEQNEQPSAAANPNSAINFSQIDEFAN